MSNVCSSNRVFGLIAAVLCALWISPSAFGDSVDGGSDYPSLRDSRDSGLQAQLEATLDNLGLLPAVRRKQLALALVDITDPQSPRLAAVNGDQMMYAASLPKIAILLGAFVEIEKGRMAYDRATRETLTRMVRVSSNRDATTMLRRIGKPRLAKILQSDRYRLYDPSVNGGLWVGKDYGKAPAWKRDPLHNLSHGATVMQVARFYYLLETQRLVNPKLCKDMKEILSKPAIHHKFVKGLDGRAGIKIYRKSGSWRRWHADSAIIEHGDRKYIVVGLAENKKGGEWLANIIGPLDDLIMRTRVALLASPDR